MYFRHNYPSRVCRELNPLNVIYYINQYHCISRYLEGSKLTFHARIGQATSTWCERGQQPRSLCRPSAGVLTKYGDEWYSYKLPEWDTSSSLNERPGFNVPSDRPMTHIYTFNQAFPLRSSFCHNNQAVYISQLQPCVAPSAASPSPSAAPWVWACCFLTALFLSHPIADRPGAAYQGG